MWQWIIDILESFEYGDMTVIEDRDLANGLDHVKRESNATWKKTTLTRLDGTYKATFYERL